MARSYGEMKDFRAIYRRQGAYHAGAEGFDGWFLRDNYAALAAACQPHHRVLDLACGEGCLGARLEVAHLAGVDYSEQALRLCAELHPGRYHELAPGDLRHLDRLDLPRRSFHRVLCSLSLMYLLPDDLDPALTQIRRFLVEGGLFAFTYPTVSAARPPNPTAAELAPDELTARLATAGFSDVQVEPLCPLVPGTVVEQSHRPAEREAARREYQARRQAMTLDNS